MTPIPDSLDCSMIITLGYHLFGASVNALNFHLKMPCLSFLSLLILHWYIFSISIRTRLKNTEAKKPLPGTPGTVWKIWQWRQAFKRLCSKVDQLRNLCDAPCDWKIWALRIAFKQLCGDYQKFNCTCNSWSQVKEACRRQSSTASCGFHGYIGWCQTV